MLPALLALSLPVLQQDTSPTPAQALETATARAEKENKRVLVRFESSKCADCLVLGKLTRNRKVARILREEYIQVEVEVGAMDRNLDFVKAMGVPLSKTGTPHLLVLDADGERVASVSGPDLKVGKSLVLDRSRFLAFLRENKVPPPVALDVLEEARARAAREGKNLFVHIGAPW